MTYPPASTLIHHCESHNRRDQLTNRHGQDRSQPGEVLLLATSTIVHPSLSSSESPWLGTV